MADSAEQAGMRQVGGGDGEKTNPAPLVIGMEFKCMPQLAAMVQHALDNYFDFVLLPLVHPRFRRDLVFCLAVLSARTALRVLSA